MQAHTKELKELYKIHRNALWSEEDETGLIYKYQSVKPYSVNSLKHNLIKYSSNLELNDPFDIMSRIHQNYVPTFGDGWELKKLLKNEIGTGYHPPKHAPPSPQSYTELVQWGERNIDRSLTNLALRAASHNDQKMLDLLSKIKEDDMWYQKILFHEVNVIAEMAKNAKVWCASKDPKNLLLWGHYADGFKGYCVGYAAYFEKNPKVLYRVNYKSRIKRISPLEVILKSTTTFYDLFLTKPKAWQYEYEYRLINITFGQEKGNVLTSQFPVDKLIIGYRMPHSDRQKLFDAIENEPVSIWEAIPIINKGYYTVMFKNLSGEIAGSQLVSYKEFERIKPKSS